MDIVMTQKWWTNHNSSFNNLLFMKFQIYNYTNRSVQLLPQAAMNWKMYRSVTKWTDCKMIRQVTHDMPFQWTISDWDISQTTVRCARLLTMVNTVTYCSWWSTNKNKRITNQLFYDQWKSIRDHISHAWGWFKVRMLYNREQDIQSIYNIYIIYIDIYLYIHYICLA